MREIQPRPFVGGGDESSAALCRKSRIPVASWCLYVCSVGGSLLYLLGFPAVYHGIMFSLSAAPAADEGRAAQPTPRPAAAAVAEGQQPSPLLSQLRVITHRPHGPIASKHLLLKRGQAIPVSISLSLHVLTARIQHVPSRACRARASHPPTRRSLLLRVSVTRLTSSIARRRMIAS